MGAISLVQAARNAVAAERAAADFYRQLRGMTRDPAAREFLDSLIRAELAHAASIEALAAEQALVLPQWADAQCLAIESAPGWEGTEDMDMATALAIALESELQASLYYEAIADAFEGDARQFFLNLAAAEAEHAELLRERMNSGA